LIEENKRSLDSPDEFFDGIEASSFGIILIEGDFFTSGRLTWNKIFTF